MTKTRKVLVRAYEDEYGQDHLGFFIATGQWADGHLAYSRIENGKIIEEDEGCYYQLRCNHGLKMFHV